MDSQQEGPGFESTFLCGVCLYFWILWLPHTVQRLAATGLILNMWVYVMDLQQAGYLSRVYPAPRPMAAGIVPPTHTHTVLGEESMSVTELL